MKDKTWCVYQHVFPNGKKYIGCTSLNPEKRWANGYGYSGQQEVFQAIIKYGWYHIRHEVIQEGLQKEEAIKLERELIENERPEVLYNSELYSNGRFIPNKKSKQSYCVGAGTRLSELNGLVTGEEWRKAIEKIGKRVISWRFESDRVIATCFGVKNELLICAEYEALFPPRGVTYQSFGYWITNVAEFTERAIKTQSVSEACKQMFDALG